MADPFLGEIRMAGFSFAPRGFALCNGQLLPINQNQALFAILGTTFGGNGQTNFALPNLQGRVPVHVGPGFTEGQFAGEVSHTLTTNELPAHTHQLIGATAPPGAQRGPSGNFYGAAQKSGSDFSLYAAGAPAATMNAGVVGNTGGGQAHSNLQPYLTVSFYIALQGIFPSRN